jgi:hypothetical protein
LNFIFEAVQIHLGLRNDCRLLNPFMTQEQQNGYLGLGCEADHSPPTSAKVKNEWGYTSSSTFAFMVCKGTILLRIQVKKTQPCAFMVCTGTTLLRTHLKLNP